MGTKETNGTFEAGAKAHSRVIVAPRMADTSVKAVDVLIAGAGIAGLLLAHELRRRGRQVVVAAAPDRPAASCIAAGLSNPMMGRRCTLAWNAGIALPAARATWNTLKSEFARSFCRSLPIIRVFASAEDRTGWDAHRAEITTAGFPTRELEAWPDGLRDPGFGAAVVEGGCLVDAPAVVDCLRTHLVEAGALVAASCRAIDLMVARDEVHWHAQDITARALVLAGGAGDIDHPLLGAIKLRPVKGELLIVRPAQRLGEFALAGSYYLAPGEAGSWICGATQTRGDATHTITPAARNELTNALERMLTIDFSVEDQRAGVRVMSPDMRPIIGPVAAGSPVHLLQGFGSRGFSLAPWCAETLADWLTAQTPLPAEIAAPRFDRDPDPSKRWNAVEVSHREAAAFVGTGDIVLDLTVGNGGDTLWLAETVGADGAVFGFDIQSGALAATQQRLNGSPHAAEVRLIHASHAAVAAFVPVEFHGRVALALANLGYWPGSDSGIVTRPETTLSAFGAALELLRPGGALIAVVYTGHKGGVAEREAIERWAGELPGERFVTQWLRHPGGASRTPSILKVVHSRSPPR